MKTAVLKRSAAPNIATEAILEVAKPPAQPGANHEDKIRLCAYHKWESAGKPAGDGVHFWLEAERELRAVAGMRIDYSRS